MCTKDTIKLDYKFSFFPYLIEIGVFVIAIFRHIYAKTTFNCHLWPCIIQFQIWSLLILIFCSIKEGKANPSLDLLFSPWLPGRWPIIIFPAYFYRRFSLIYYLCINVKYKFNLQIVSLWMFHCLLFCCLSFMWENKLVTAQYHIRYIKVTQINLSRIHETRNPTWKTRPSHSPRNFIQK